MKVAIVGTGFTGLVTGATLAEMGHAVTCIDTDRGMLARLRERILPFQEPGLAALVRRNSQELRLDFNSSLGDGVRGAEVVILALPSPIGADGVTDMSEWATVGGRLASLLRPYTVVIVAGTVRPGGTQLLRTILEEDGRRVGRDFDVVAVPALFSHGAAVAEALSPRRIVVGGATEHAMRVLRRCYTPFLRDGAHLVTVDERSAETLRYAAAALRVALFGVTREIAGFCEEGGAEVAEVLAHMVGDESGARILRRSLGAAPATRDIREARAMVELANNWGCAPWTLEAALEQVPHTAEGVIQRLRAALDDELDGKRVGVWGMAGVSAGDDPDAAVGLRILRSLLGAGAHLVIHAPGSEDDVRASLGGLVDLTDAPLAALASAHALVVLSDIPSMRAIDLSRARRLMTRPVIVDPLALWNAQEMRNAGIAYNGGAGAPAQVAVAEHAL